MWQNNLQIKYGKREAIYEEKDADQVLDSVIGKTIKKIVENVGTKQRV